MNSKQQLVFSIILPSHSRGLEDPGSLFYEQVT